MQRIVTRQIPCGDIRTVHPFHISLEGHETAILFRDDEDYDSAVKILCVCARRKNVIVIIYAVVSNHCHAAILAASHSDAYDFGTEVKKMISMHFSFRYGKSEIMQHIDIQAIPLYDDWHVRNTLAYIPRNALDNGGNVTEYKWSGFKAVFRDAPLAGRPVSSLTKRESEKIMHTGDKLKDTSWLLDDDGYLIAESWCDNQYLEQAFENDAAFFFRLIGGVDPAQMHEILIDNPKRRMNDSEYFKYVSELCGKWYKTDIDNITIDKKKRLATVLFRTTRTSVPQLARALGLSREETEKAIIMNSTHRKRSAHRNAE